MLRLVAEGCVPQRGVEKGVFDLLTMIPRRCAGEGGVENVGDGGATEI
jgi:hypothetical protein